MTKGLFLRLNLVIWLYFFTLQSKKIDIPLKVGLLPKGIAIFFDSLLGVKSPNKTDLC